MFNVKVKLNISGCHVGELYADTSEAPIQPHLIIAFPSHAPATPDYQRFLEVLFKNHYLWIPSQGVLSIHLPLSRLSFPFFGWQSLGAEFAVNRL